MSKAFWLLDIGTYLEFGIWLLEFYSFILVH
jgi:hypothetical protein